MRKTISALFACLFLCVIFLNSCGPKTVVTVKRTGEKVSISTHTSVSDSSSTAVDVNVNPTIQLGEPIAQLSSSEFNRLVRTSSLPIEVPKGDFELVYSVAELKELFPDYRAKLHEKKTEKLWSQNHSRK